MIAIKWSISISIPKNKNKIPAMGTSKHRIVQDQNSIEATRNQFENVH